MIKLEFSNLESKHLSFQETYKDMSNTIKNKNEFKVDIKKVKYDSNHFH